MINSWAAKKAHFRIELACKCSTFEKGREQNSQTSSRGVARDGLAMAWTLKLRISLAMCLQSGTRTQRTGMEGAEVCCGAHIAEQQEYKP
jgi:hypothetical protein